MRLALFHSSSWTPHNGAVAITPKLTIFLPMLSSITASHSTCSRLTECYFVVRDENRFIQFRFRPTPKASQQALGNGANDPVLFTRHRPLCEFASNEETLFLEDLSVRRSNMTSNHSSNNRFDNNGSVPYLPDCHPRVIAVENFIGTRRPI